VIRRLPPMILYAVCLHLCWGILGLIDETTYFSTAPSALFRLFGPYTGVLCIMVGTAAAVGLCARMRPTSSLLCLIPQQIFLVISAVGAVHAMSAGQFADGIERSRYFIVGDQAPAVLAAFGHTWAMLRFLVREG
jgi:hypothetical protein